MAFLPPLAAATSDSFFNSVSYSWKQVSGERELGITIFLHAPCHKSADIGAKDVAVHLVNNDVLQIDIGGSGRLLDWKLHGSVNPEVFHWELKRLEQQDGKPSVAIDVTLEKEEAAEPWPCLLVMPLTQDERRDMFLSDEQLQQIVDAQHPSLPADFSLDGASSSSSSSNSNSSPADKYKFMVQQAMEKSLREQHQTLAGAHAKMTKLLQREGEGGAAAAAAEMSADEKAVLESNLRQVELMTQILKKDMETAKKRPTIDGLIEMVKLKIHMNLANTQALNPNSTNFADLLDEEPSAEEAQLGAEALFKSAVDRLKSASQEGVKDAVHLLRVAALRKNSAKASILLSQLYERFRAASLSIYFVLRAALLHEGPDATDGDPDGGVANKIVSDMVESGVLTPHAPSFALAIYFVQRAALAGPAPHPGALAALTHLLRVGKVTKNVPNLPECPDSRDRCAKRLLVTQAALKRGLPDMYLLCGIGHLRGDGLPKNVELGKQYFELLKSAGPDMWPKVHHLVEDSDREQQQSASSSRLQQVSSSSSNKPQQKLSEFLRSPSLSQPESKGKKMG